MLFRLPSRRDGKEAAVLVHETGVQEKLAEPSLRDLKTRGGITLGQDESTERLSGRKRTER